MVKKKYRAAIIGAGRIGFTLQFDRKREQPASHSNAFSMNKRIILTSACDIDAVKLKKWKRYYNESKTYDDPCILLENEKPDIVSIAVDEESHLDVFKKVVRHRPRLIILEKPVAPNLKDAFSIYRSSLKYDVPVAVNHERRFSLDYIQAKALIEKKKLGDIHHVYALFSSNVKVYSKDAEKTGDCSLIHDGTHLVDILIFLFGVEFNRPEIQRIAINKKKEIRMLSLSFEEKIASGGKNGTLFQIEINGEKEYFGFDIEISGSKGKILIGNGYFKFYERKMSPFYKNFHSLVRDHKISRPEETGYFSNMIKNCTDFLDGSTGLVSPLSEGIKTLKILYGIIKKLKMKIC
jgi:predicted dehydrogenase